MGPVFKWLGLLKKQTSETSGFRMFLVLKWSVFESQLYSGNTTLTKVSLKPENLEVTSRGALKFPT